MRGGWSPWVCSAGAEEAKGSLMASAAPSRGQEEGQGWSLLSGDQRQGPREWQGDAPGAVSYTHLTLPTTILV